MEFQQEVYKLLQFYLPIKPILIFQYLYNNHRQYYYQGTCFQFLSYNSQTHFYLLHLHQRQKTKSMQMQTISPIVKYRDHPFQYFRKIKLNLISTKHLIICRNLLQLLLQGYKLNLCTDFLLLLFLEAIFQKSHEVHLSVIHLYYYQSTIKYKVPILNH